MRDRPCAGNFSAFLEFDDGTPATVSYNGYGYFDTSELTWSRGTRMYSDEERTAVRRSLSVLCVLLALQGVVGLDQYETHLPTELVWVHVGLACGAWLAALWAACAAGRLAPRGARIVAERTVGGPLRPRPPLKFPGN